MRKTMRSGARRLLAAALVIAAPAIAEAQQFVYTANLESNDISAFKLNIFTGALTPVPGSPFTTGWEPRRLTLDRNGRFLYVDVSVFFVIRFPPQTIELR